MTDVASIYASTDWDEYARVRPVYPTALYDEIFAYHSQSKDADWEVTLDIGAGNGTAGPPLLQKFQRYVASDFNAAQVEETRTHLAPRFAAGRVDARVGAGEEMQTWAKDLTGQVDLVACGEAIHWLDDVRFVHEASEMVKPGGTLALWFYGLEPGVLTNHPKIKAALEAVLPHSLPVTPALESASRVKNSKMDSVSTVPFEEELRIRWEIPSYVQHTSEDAAFLATQPCWTDKTRVQVEIRRPTEAKEVALQRGPWGLSDVQGYMASQGGLKDLLLQSPAWKQVEAAFADECPDGRKEVLLGWSLTLVLARRPA